MGVATAPTAEQRFLLYNVSWQEYEGLLRSLGDRRLRHTYDRGTLELMSPSKNHEWAKSIIGDLVTCICRLTRTPRQSIGSTTFRREDWERGLEADEGFYIGEASLKRVGGRRNYDPDSDPPPDLVVEVDITRSSLNRMQIYREMGVPEVWRYDDRQARFYRLDKKGHYREVKRSRLFPFLGAEDLTRFLAMRTKKDDTALELEFENWVREQVGEDA